MHFWPSFVLLSIRVLYFALPIAALARLTTFDADASCNSCSSHTFLYCAGTGRLSIQSLHSQTPRDVPSVRCSKKRKHQPRFQQSRQSVIRLVCRFITSPCPGCTGTSPVLLPFPERNRSVGVAVSSDNLCTSLRPLSSSPSDRLPNCPANGERNVCNSTIYQGEQKDEPHWV